MKGFVYASIALLAGFASALPSTIKARDCTYIPPGADANIVNAIYKVALGRGVTDSKSPLSSL